MVRRATTETAPEQYRGPGNYTWSPPSMIPAGDMLDSNNLMVSARGGGLESVPPLRMWGGVGGVGLIGSTVGTYMKTPPGPQEFPVWVDGHGGTAEYPGLVISNYATYIFKPLSYGSSGIQESAFVYNRTEDATDIGNCVLDVWDPHSFSTITASDTSMDWREHLWAGCMVKIEGKYYMAYAVLHGSPNVLIVEKAASAAGTAQHVGIAWTTGFMLEQDHIDDYGLPRPTFVDRSLCVVYPRFVDIATADSGGAVMDPLGAGWSMTLPSPLPSGFIEQKVIRAPGARMYRVSGRLGTRLVLGDRLYDGDAVATSEDTRVSTEIVWSAAGDPSTFEGYGTGTAVLSVPGGRVLALIESGNVLLALGSTGFITLSETGVYSAPIRATGPTDYVPPYFDAMHPYSVYRSLVQTPMGVVYLGEDFQLYVISGGSVRALKTGVPTFELKTFAQDAQRQILFDRERKTLFLISGAQHMAIEIDPSTGKWWRRGLFPPQSGYEKQVWTFAPVFNVNHLLVREALMVLQPGSPGGPNPDDKFAGQYFDRAWQGAMSVDEVGNVSNRYGEMYMTTRSLALTPTGERKYLRGVRLLMSGRTIEESGYPSNSGNPGSVTCHVRTDRDDWDAPTGSPYTVQLPEVTDHTAQFEIRFGFNCSGYDFQFKFDLDTIRTDVRIRGIIVEYQLGGSAQWQ